jgi:hypothetical protein
MRGVKDLITSVLKTSMKSSEDSLLHRVSKCSGIAEYKVFFIFSNPSRGAWSAPTLLLEVKESVKVSRSLSNLADVTVRMPELLRGVVGVEPPGVGYMALETTTLTSSSSLSARRSAEESSDASASRLNLQCDASQAL